jgi:hypothetical protein
LPTSSAPNAVFDFLNETVPPALATEVLALRLAWLALLVAVIVIARAPAWRQTAMIVAGALLGLICLENTYGLRFVDPREYGWVMNGKDARWHNIGWVFFRNEAWHMPPGKIAHMLYPVGTSIANTDSLPLLAFVFKPFSPFLPPDFQYFGLWYLLSAVARGALAALLLSTFRAHWSYQLAAVALFVWGPGSFLSLDHAARAAGVPLCLAGLWLYFRPRDRDSPRREVYAWLGLAALGAWMNPYLCVMILGLCAATLLRRWWPDRVATAAQTAMRLAAVVLVVLLSWWLAGYFELANLGQMQGGPLGIWSMDLLAPINPWGLSSTWLPAWQIGSGQYEGLFYLGLGVIDLTLWVAVLAVWRPPSPAAIRQVVPLLAVCLVFTAAALSPTVTVAGQVVLRLPERLYAPLAPFRASARFFLPVSCALLYLLLRFVAARLKPALALALMLVCLLIQRRDLGPARQEMRARWSAAATFAWKESLDWEAWRPLVDGQRLLRLVPPERWGLDSILPFVYLAARSGLAAPGGDAARLDAQALAEAARSAQAAFERGSLETETLYVMRADDPDPLPRNSAVSCQRIGAFRACWLNSDTGAAARGYRP